MLQLSQEDICNQTAAYYEDFLHGTKSAIMEKDMIETVFPRIVKQYNRTYPYDVKIPKSFEEMLEGDFTPSRIIHVEKPFECDWGPMWFGDTTNGVKLRYGYINGDSRQESNFFLGEGTVHGIMAGTSGSGKSVALNAVIYGMCLEYAPWELNLILSDAKITEFKAIALNNPMPHIQAIAATEDTDYLISVVEYYFNRMNKLQSVFAKAGEVFGKDVKNVKDFRKTTGLTLPRNLLIFDEFQAMFAKAGRRLNHLVQLIDMFARLGRNAGYHLYLTSQDLGSDIPQATLNNIMLRCALGCTAAVSERLIGNDAAKVNNGKPGRLVVNTKFEDEGGAKNNVHITVPFCSPDNSNAISSMVISKGKEIGVEAHIAFYDEAAILRFKDHVEYLHKFAKDDNRLILGELAQMNDDPEGVLSIRYKGESNENILVCAEAAENQIRHFLALRNNIVEKAGKQIGIVGESFFTENGAKELLGKMYFDDPTFSSDFFSIISYTIYKRSICIAADKQIFELNDTATTDETNEIFYSIVEKGSDSDTELNKARCYQIIRLLKTEMYEKHFGSDMDSVKELIGGALYDYNDFGCNKKQMVTKDLPVIYSWVLGLQKILKLGRDSSGKCVTAFKQMLQDSSQVNVRFIIITSNVEETYEIRGGVKWVILDRASQTDISRLKVGDFYPASMPNVLAILFDMDRKEHPTKFKRVFFDKENA